MVKFELCSIAIGVLGASNHSLPNGWIEFRGGREGRVADISRKLSLEILRNIEDLFEKLVINDRAYEDSR